MARIALIDDDATEAMILEGMLEHGGDGHALVHLSCVAALQAVQEPVDLVLLDRRLPPHETFAEGVAALARTGWRGPVVLITAYSDEAAPSAPEGLALIGPVDKADLLSPEAVSALVARALGRS
ncbi:MAG: hypothetical protein ACLFQ5_09670 [Oceanicaulis sp.]